MAYRKLTHPGQNEYTGGVIFEDGSGWHEEPGATAALGEGQKPWAVAGLPDGGAAFTAQSPTEGARIVERESASSAWQSIPYPGGFAPGALTLFREGAALRAIGTGGEPETFTSEDEIAPPPGFPPILVDPYPLVANFERGVLRQTATGWSDEEHELNDAREPPGEYFNYDTPYVPDPVSAVLVDPSGSQGWAVGGVVDDKHAMLDTADVYRYRDTTSPEGESAYQEAPARGTAFAVGGGAQCEAPCATRAETKIGPDVWLSSAINEAATIPGVQAFFYTGPRVTTGRTAGPATVPVPYEREQDRYEKLLSGHSLPVYPVPSATDLDATKTELSFRSAFGTLPFANAGCAGTPACSYYAETLGSVKVLTVDDSSEVGKEQLEWLSGELSGAAAAHQAAVVVGSADLPSEYAQRQRNAVEIVGVLEAGHASAYFFESPEANVHETIGSVPAFGSGTLGYESVVVEELGGFIGASGFLVAEVGTKQEANGRFPVGVRLIPNVGELAVEAQQGPSCAAARWPRSPVSPAGRARAIAPTTRKPNRKRAPIYRSPRTAWAPTARRASSPATSLNHRIPKSAGL